MSNGFKKTLSTVSVFITMAMSVVTFMLFSIGQSLGSFCQGWVCYITGFYVLLGPATLLFYLIFLKTKKDLFFWLASTPLAFVVGFFFINS